jgi:hypothetical protein
MAQIVTIATARHHRAPLAGRIEDPTTLTGRGLPALVLFYCHQHPGPVTVRDIQTALLQYTGDSVDYSQIHVTFNNLESYDLVHLCPPRRTIDGRGRKSKPAKTWGISPQGTQALREHRTHLAQLTALLDTML